MLLRPAKSTSSIATMLFQIPIFLRTQNGRIEPSGPGWDILCINQKRNLRDVRYAKPRCTRQTNDLDTLFYGRGTLAHGVMPRARVQSGS